MTFNKAAYIDIHCHLLPGIDDGPRTMEESLLMARHFAKSGVKRVIATPHFLPGTAWSASKVTVLDLVAALQEKLYAHQIDLEVLPGMEIAFHATIGRRLARNELLSLGGSGYYLIEPPFHGSQDDLLAGLASLINAGHNCILAHPERVDELVNNLAALKRLVNLGLLIQITAPSLLGSFGAQTRKAALTLWQNGCGHFVASDAHSAQKRGPLTNGEWKQLIDDPATSHIIAAGNRNISSIFS
jgi:protein-tyrosine phosphatase